MPSINSYDVFYNSDFFRIGNGLPNENRNIMTNLYSGKVEGGFKSCSRDSLSK